MSPTEALALCAAGAAAGAVNAVAGGGTLISFPALMFFGTSAIVANATNSLALFLGTAGSIFSFRRQLAAVKPWLVRFVPVSIAGGWIGGVLLTQTSERVFAQLVPFLLLFATIIFIAQGVFRRFVAPDRPHHRVVWLAIVFQFGVAVYGGYFGAGIGILMLASLGFIGLGDLHEVNALKNVLAGVINFTAALWFVASGLIDWPRAAIMTAGAVGGYFLGAHFSQRVPQKIVRHVITAVGLAISGYFFWRQFG
jgi:uncharacterized membrane protein YfcA